MRTKILLFLGVIIISCSLSAQQREASSFTIKSPDKTFVGAVLDPKSINTDQHQFVQLTKPDFITVSSLVQGDYSQEIKPSYESMMRVVREWVGNKKLIQQQAFTFGIKEINSYEELNSCFGQNINSEKFFGISQDAQVTNNTLMVSITQEFFSVDMDMPDNGILHYEDPEVSAHRDDFIYVNSVTFGKKIIVLVSSQVELSKMKNAVNEALSAKPNTLSQESRAILSNSDIEVMILGNPDLGSYDVAHPFEAVMEYLKRPVTLDDFGVPIHFSAASLRDHASFVNHF